MRALMRFLSWRIVAALLVVTPLLLISREIVGLWRPEGVEQLSSEGLTALRRLVSATYSLIFGVWAWCLVKSFVGAFPPRVAPWIARGARAWCWATMLLAAPLAFQTTQACAGLPWSDTAILIRAWLWITVTPLAIGSLPMAFLLITEVAKASPTLYAWFYAGRGEYGGFAGSYKQWQNSEPMLKELK